jgi:hypothetical protein
MRYPPSSAACAPARSASCCIKLRRPPDAAKHRFDPLRNRAVPAMVSGRCAGPVQRSAAMSGGGDDASATVVASTRRAVPSETRARSWRQEPAAGAPSQHHGAAAHGGMSGDVGDVQPSPKQYQLTDIIRKRKKFDISDKSDNSIERTTAAVWRRSGRR